MRTDLTRDKDRRTTAAALAATFLLTPVLLAPMETPAVALPAAFALVVALLRLPVGNISLPVAALAVAVVSGAGSLVFLLGKDGWGEARWALPWMPFELVALAVLITRVIRRTPVVQAAGLGLVLAVAVLALPLRFSLRNPHSVLEQSVLGVMFGFILVLIATGIALHLRAQDYRRSEEVSRARREQRLEVARDLHDFVAHEVTGILLETQAAQVEEYDRAQTHELLERLEAAGQRALVSMDDTLRMLREPGARPEPPSTRVHGLADLPDLLGRFDGSSTARTRLDLESELAGALPREVEDAAFRLVLECLTNIRRHAPQARQVTVTAACPDGPPRELRITVTDDGAGRGGSTASGPRTGGGTGLLALTERFTGLRGALEAGPGPAGWLVVGTLPIDRSAI